MKLIENTLSKQNSIRKSLQRDIIINLNLYVYNIKHNTKYEQFFELIKII